MRCASQYGEFRKGFRLKQGHDTEDTRVVAYGIRYIVQTYLERRWTLADVEAAAHFYRHGRPRRALRQPRCPAWRR